MQTTEASVGQTHNAKAGFNWTNTHAKAGFSLTNTQCKRQASEAWTNTQCKRQRLQFDKHTMQTTDASVGQTHNANKNLTFCFLCYKHLQCLEFENLHVNHL